ncbi:MAG: aldo/keto reductase [Anaerovoracaceae bacterium]
MKQVRLGKTNIFVSPVGFGVLTMGKTQLNLNLKDGADLIKYGISKGINFFDTAQYYETYPYLREALKDYDSEDIVICSKSLDWGYFQMKYAVSECLLELDRKYVDIFLLHELRPDEDRSGAWEYLREAKKAGVVKAIGVSTHHTDVAKKALDFKDIDVLFPLINLEGLGIRTGKNKGTKEDMEMVIKTAYENNIGVFGMKAFGGGNLTGRYIEALDYVTNITGIDSIMIGFGQKKEIDKAISYFDGTIDRNYIPDLSNKKIHIEAGNCEACGSCLNRCPNKAIYIEDNMAHVNHNICLTCGYCAPVCPTRAIILY